MNQQTRSSNSRLLLTLSLLLLALASVVVGVHTGSSPATTATLRTIGTTTEGEAQSNPERAASAGNEGARSVVATKRLPGFYSAPCGSRFVYLLRAETTYGMHRRSDPGAGGQTRVGLRGHMTVEILDRRAGEILTSCSITGAQLTLGDHTVTAGEPDLPEEVRRLVTAAETELLVRLDAADGSILGYQFGSAIGGDARNFMRAFVAAFSFPVPADADGTWDATEADATGRYLASYSREAAQPDGTFRVWRRKLRYTELAASYGASPELRIGGAASATLSQRLGWLQSANVDEKIAFDLQEMDAVFQMRLAGNLRFVRADSVALRPTEDLWPTEWSAASGHQEQVGGNSEAEERRLLIEKLADVDPSMVVNDLRTLLAAGQSESREVYQAWTTLHKLVELRPEAAEEVGNLVRNGHVAGELAQLLITALGAAGSESAQGTLVALRADASLAANLREGATIAMVQLAQPQARVIESLVGDLRARSRLDGADSTTLLTLGTLAARSGEVLSNGRTAYQSLLDLEDRARRQDALDNWLAALGNVGSVHVMTHLARYVQHENPKLRAAAVQAMRLLHTKGNDVAREALQRVVTYERVPEIRDLAQSILERGGKTTGS